MKLHEAIDSVLAEHPDGLTAKDIARQINRRFDKLHRARNDIAHGSRRLREKDPPSEDMRALLPRYLTLALSA